MFASPTSSSSSSSETPQLNAVEAAARAHAVKTRRARRKIDDQEAEIRKALDDHATEAASHKGQTNQDQSRYIGKLVAAAQLRKDDAQRLAERRLVLQRQEQDATFPEKPRFITKSYRAALQRQSHPARDPKTKHLSSLSSSDPNVSSKEKKPTSDVLHTTDAIQSTSYASLLRFMSTDRPVPNTDSDTLRLADEKSELAHDTVTSLSPREQLGRHGLHEDHASGLTSHDGDIIGHNLLANTGLKVKPQEQPRKSRFSSAGPSAAAAAPSDLKSALKESQKKRGLRRNDDQAVEAYRQRYFKRLAALHESARNIPARPTVQPTPILH